MCELKPVTCSQSEMYQVLASEENFKSFQQFLARWHKCPGRHEGSVEAACVIQGMPSGSIEALV
jgi:hypothetical protein